MKKIVLSISALAMLLMASCCGGDKVAFTVSNGASFDRSEEMVEIPVERLESIKLKDGQAYVVKNSKGDVLPSQLTYDGLLIFQSGLAANASEKFTVSAGAAQEFTPKVAGRFVPERLDDYMWENDRVGFRVYGDALIAKDGPSNGIDLNYKRTNELVLDDWMEKYVSEGRSYHIDHGAGMDDYKVGRTLGAGAMAPYVNGKLILNNNYLSYETYENGPLRTTFRLTYPEIEVNGKKYSENRTFSLDAGSQMTKVMQEYGFTEPTTVAAGIARRAKSDTHITGSDWVIYEEPATKRSEGVWVSVVVPQGLDKVVIDEYTIKAPKGSGTYMHTLAVTEYNPGVPATYYTGFGWEKFGYPTVASFREYIENFSHALAEPLTVSYE